MSETEAAEALLARLSYQASVRAGELAKRAATKLPVINVAKIAFIFCLLVSNSMAYLFIWAFSTTQYILSPCSLFILVIAIVCALTTFSQVR